MKPFRLGSTSYVYPADLVENARQLAGIVDDIQLILFDNSQYGTNFPTSDVIKHLNEIAWTNQLTYTVHLPRDANLGDLRAFDQNRRAIDATRALNPTGYVTHLDGKVLLEDKSPQAVAAWQAVQSETLRQVIGWVGDPALVCVENVEGWDPEYFADVVVESGVSRCIDIGHLWKEGCDPILHLEKHLAKTRVIHLHGIGTNDHQSLSHMRDEQLFPVIKTLITHNYRGVVTLEVFGQQDFFTSSDTLLHAINSVVQ